ncbi:MAG: ketol-acid reductoisomerase [Archaeoglobus sp.]|nr:ketol-acid reductoisomerase [Archaeoglobus sp.]
MGKIYYDTDAQLDILKSKTIGVIGYGSQGRAQALNMRDSGLNVIVGLRKDGKSWSKAEKDGFRVYEIEEVVKESDVVHLLITDTIMPKVYKDRIRPYLKNEQILGFSHAFNVHFNQIIPPEYVDVLLVAPKAPGPMLREQYERGSGVPGLIAVYQDFSGSTKDVALAMAKAIGLTRIGVLETTFKKEAESDIIGEQCVLVGGLIGLIKAGFEVLVESGYDENEAYFEVLNEAKLIMDLIYQSGFTGMLNAVSDTAKYGGLIKHSEIIDEHVKNKMREVVKEVQSGKFAKDWLIEIQSNFPSLKVLMEQISSHQIEIVGRRIRKLAGIEK